MKSYKFICIMTKDTILSLSRGEFHFKSHKLHSNSDIYNEAEKLPLFTKI